MIKTVTLLPCIKKNISKETILQVLHVLEMYCDRVLMEKEVAEILNECSPVIEYCDNEHVFNGSELVIVMGGDGSIIEASRRVAYLNIPVLGINCGRLGFLAELEVNESELLCEILKGNFRIEERMMLDVTVLRDDEEHNVLYPCLNDVVLSNGPVPRLSGFDLYCDATLITRYSADGIIISTPTGSSAYSMSAGGPLIFQTMECICATPICPHSFTHRPVVFLGNSVIELKNAYCRENKMYITVDGREHMEILCGDTVRIKKSAEITRLVRVKEGGLVSVLNRKLSEMDISSV